ncbi:hypothetical protein TRIATDRAFT_302111 [Trichoderma atroviride IMI 206040]|uniref:Uncharacterized protein n=1 Tax=Hypocrea atroviridis (strain ATCC 20476 / IMI 206040) TaxID=452589 RepID=G9P7W8_HYPAI|nr:uncharacterized protein TRIATDRAFT_302111 [Trichoderma atroviride IMI 206040]EHK41655.1 hypothetical protein TRIATDRAFT_302111 [Trichoderma atroviride IMI 206040]
MYASDMVYPRQCRSCKQCENVLEYLYIQAFSNLFVLEDFYFGRVGDFEPSGHGLLRNAIGSVSWFHMTRKTHSRIKLNGIMTSFPFSTFALWFGCSLPSMDAFTPIRNTRAYATTDTSPFPDVEQLRVKKTSKVVSTIATTKNLHLRFIFVPISYKHGYAL